jgi:peroxisomal 2,4-dienoyl-CoA reductase
VQAVKRSTPLQRLGETWNIADATVFLFSEAGSYVTGEVLVVDGGHWHMGKLASKEYPDALMKGEVIAGVKGMKLGSKL